ncbi:MAG: carboxypeptidase regulatory-like domain-containing protein [Bacteroidetes bacterium]|nr:carboxypeptidase regulatory-like domain-containing protein [Bacteroidota bacterium]
MSNLIRLSFFVLSFFLLSAQARQSTATLHGLITDARNQPLMGVTVVVKHVPTNTFRGTLTENNGEFELRNLRAGGPYLLTLSYTGYKTVYRDSILLNDGERKRMDFMMQ